MSSSTSTKPLLRLVRRDSARDRSGPPRRSGRLLRDTGAAMADAVRIFAEHAPAYHALRRRLVPGLDDLYGTAADLLALRGGPLARVLDLGAGTGLLSAYVAERHPGVELVLVDGAAAMLEQARRLLAPHATTVLVQDLRDALPAGPFDAVV